MPWINPPKHGLNKLTNTWWRHKVFSALLTLGDIITLWRYCVWGVSQNSREITHAPSTHRDLLGSNRRASFLSQVNDVISPLCLQCMMQSLGTFIFNNPSANGFMRSCQERPNIWDQQNRIHINNGQFNWKKMISLQWSPNGRDSAPNHQPHDCVLNRLFRGRSKKTSKPGFTGLCVGNSPGTGEFPAQMASNAENVSIWWRHHAVLQPLQILRM